MAWGAIALGTVAVGKVILYHVINSDLDIKLQKKQKAVCVEVKVDDTGEVETVVEKMHEYYECSGDVVLPSINKRVKFDSAESCLHITSIDKNTLRFFTKDESKSDAMTSVLTAIRTQYQEESNEYVDNKTKEKANRINSLAKLYKGLKAA